MSEKNDILPKTWKIIREIYLNEVRKEKKAK